MVKRQSVHFTLAENGLYEKVEKEEVVHLMKHQESLEELIDQVAEYGKGVKLLIGE